MITIFLLDTNHQIEHDPKLSAQFYELMYGMMRLSGLRHYDVKKKITLAIIIIRFMYNVFLCFRKQKPYEMRQSLEGVAGTLRSSRMRC